MLDMIDENQVVTVKQAVRLSGKCPKTLSNWVAAGFLRIAPRWGRELGDRIFVSDLLECMGKPQRSARGPHRRRASRCPSDRVWYKNQIDNTRIRRIFEPDAEREKRLAWQRTYQRGYSKRKKELKP